VERSSFNLGEQQAISNCRFLQLLLNDEVSKVSMSWLPREKNRVAMKSITDMWFAMSEKCPRMRKIECNNFFTRKSRGLLILFSFSLNFTQLQVLNMTNMRCTDLRLSLVAEHLLQLR
jgi:hypothetical protein